MQLLNKTLYHTLFTCRVSTDDKFYLVPLSASQEVLEIDRLNFELSLIGKPKSGLRLPLCLQYRQWYDSGMYVSSP